MDLSAVVSSTPDLKYECSSLKTVSICAIAAFLGNFSSIHLFSRHLHSGRYTDSDGNSGADRPFHPKIAKKNPDPISSTNYPLRTLHSNCSSNSTGRSKHPSSRKDRPASENRQQRPTRPSPGEHTSCSMLLKNLWLQVLVRLVFVADSDFRSFVGSPI